MTTISAKRRVGVLSAACALTTVVLAACGGHAPRRIVSPPPKLPRALASELASLGDSVATKLDHGDSCGALKDASTLQSEAIAAADTGTVRPALRTPLTRAVNTLVSEIHCTKPSPHPKPPKGEHKGHHGEGG